MQEPNLNFQQKQLKKLEEIGSSLHQLRLEKRMSIEEISAQTFIRARLLRAIEQGQMEELPEPVYIRKSIEKFANALGQNGAEFAKKFDLDVDPKNSLPEVKQQQAKSPASRQLPSLPPFQFRLPFQLRPYHLYIFYIFLIVMSVKFLANLVEPSSLQANRSQNQELITTQSSLSNTNQIAETPQSPIVSQLATSQSSKSVMVDVKVKDRCWVRVMVDGKKDFEGFLDGGVRRTWTANKQLTIRAGNAGGVFVTLNDKNEAKQLGKPGEVEEVTYKANAGF
jgi:cytoskeletal protein RodZ